MTFFVFLHRMMFFSFQLIVDIFRSLFAISSVLLFQISYNLDRKGKKVLIERWLKKLLKNNVLLDGLYQTFNKV